MGEFGNVSKLSDRPVALVSGSATGIGAACAKRFAESGYNVAINYSRNEPDARKTEEICRSTGADTLCLQGDISDDDACRSMVADISKQWGRMNVLVNNAGMTRFVEADDLDGLSIEDFDRIFAVNVTGCFQLTRAAAPSLKVVGNGAVVNISSHSGFSGIGSSIAYAASKGALNTLTLSLARTLAPEVRVNAVCPGFVDTQWLSGKFDEQELARFRDKVRRIAPLSSVVSPQDVADTVLWFGTAAPGITGQLLVIDGGTHLTVGDPL